MSWRRWSVGRYKVDKVILIPIPVTSYNRKGEKGKLCFLNINSCLRPFKIPFRKSEFHSISVVN